MPTISSAITYTLGRGLYVALTNRCNAGTSLIASRGPGFVIPAASGFRPLEADPSPDQAISAVEAALTNADFDEVCFAGAGEPLLRLTCLEQVARQIRDARPDITLRLNTNGLIPSSEADSVASRLKSAGIEATSVALATADPTQYAELMKPQPLRYSPAFSLKLGHADVAAFIKACVATGMRVEATAVAAPGVDIDAAKELSAELGASFRSRSWHPAVDE